MAINFKSVEDLINTQCSGLLGYGAQLYISRDGQYLFDKGFGFARPDVPMLNSTMNLWMSSTKPVAAIAIAQLVERRGIQFTEPVVNFIPEFGQNGKSAITIEHILTHTAGFRAPPKTQDVPWEDIIAEICAARLETGWIPGQKAGYHPMSSWYILGEIVRRISGIPFGDYVRQNIFLPLGMRDSWIGMKEEKYEADENRIAVVYENTHQSAKAMDMKKVITSCRPGSNGIGPIRDLAKVYEMLLNEGNRYRQQVLSPELVRTITARHRRGMMDVTFKTPIDWGYGFLLNGESPSDDLPYGYCTAASPATFGHGGFQSSGAFCDPAKKLVVAYVFNAMPGEENHQARRKALIKAIYDAVG